MLQNADDAGDGDRKVEFILTNSYLILLHDGKHFTEEDVKAITDFASPEREKVRGPKTTGYMGIGFKSVFNYNETVIILSQEATLLLSC